MGGDRQNHRLVLLKGKCVILVQYVRKEGESFMGFLFRLAEHAEIIHVPGESR